VAAAIGDCNFNGDSGRPDRVVAEGWHLRAPTKQGDTHAQDIGTPDQRRAALPLKVTP
jgi:hypothetical protein